MASTSPSNIDVAKWLDLLPRPLREPRAAVLTIDHVVKDKEARGRYAIGAQHKLAGVDCAYTATVLEPFGRGRDGKVKLTVMKDRPGHVRGYADEGTAAIVHLTSRADGAVVISLEPPDAGPFRPTALMERVSRVIEETPGISKRGIRDVKGQHAAKDLAVELLLSEGYIRREQEGQATKHYSTRPYREEEDRAPVPEPCPDRAPAHPESNRAPVPPPLRHGAQGAVDVDTLNDDDRARAERRRVPGGEPS